MNIRAIKTLKRRGRLGRSSRTSIGSVVRSALADDVLRLLMHEPGARRGDPEHVHQMRTAVRRLRSDLRFYGPSLADTPAGPLRDELRWLAGVLGAVRDLDVLGRRLRDAVVALGLVAPSEPLFEAIDRRRAAGLEALRAALDGERYQALRAAILDEARGPTLADGADRPAGPVLIDRLARDWRRFLDALRGTPADAPGEALHEFRKRAKRTRYAAESAGPWLGGRGAKVASRIGREAKRVQEILGDAQDAHVAAEFLRDLMPALPADGPARAAAAALVDREAAEAAEALARYRELRDRLLDD